jgi:hypothetical protein
MIRAVGAATRRHPPATVRWWTSFGRRPWRIATRKDPADDKRPAVSAPSIGSESRYSRRGARPFWARNGSVVQSSCTVCSLGNLANGILAMKLVGRVEGRLSHFPGAHPRPHRASLRKWPALPWCRKLSRQCIGVMYIEALNGLRAFRNIVVVTDMPPSS